MIGAGGTGKTHQLQRWVDELEPAGAVTWLRGNPLRPIDADQVVAALDDRGTGGGVVVADDLQWFTPDALEALAASGPDTVILASHRPPGGGDPAGADLLDLVGQTVAAGGTPTRTGLAGLDPFAPILASIRAGQGQGGGGAMSSDELAAVHRLTAGSVGLAADVVSSGWHPDPDPATDPLDTMPGVVIDAVTRRVRQAGAGAEALVALWAVAAQLTPDHDPLAAALGALAAPGGAEAEAHDPARAERAARAAGLVTDDDRLIPLVAAAVLADLTRAERGARHDRLAALLAPTDPAVAARHLLAGSGTVDGAEHLLAAAALALAPSAPAEAEAMLDRAADLGLPATEQALLHGLIAFHAGSPEALGHLDRYQQASGGSLDERAALLSFGLDLRELRFESAHQRPLAGELGPPLADLARSLIGELGLERPPAGAETSPVGRLADAMAEAIDALARGEAADSLGQVTTAADDFDRLQPTSPFGITPHTLGALTALVVGDLTAADILCRQGLDRTSGGPGEQLTHELVRAYSQLVDGEYGASLALLRHHAGSPDPADGVDGSGLAAEPGTGTEDDAPTPASPSEGGPGPVELSQRDRLLVATLEAAVARRSGDTGRLRAAWARAEEALIRQSASWLLIDVFTELLACGARLSDTRRVEPVVEALCAQAEALPTEGPGPAAAHWLRLQMVLATERGSNGDRVSEVAALAEVMDGLSPIDARSRARTAAARMWATVLAGESTEEEVTRVASQLSAVGDGWEASRLLGQAALDEEDPKVARRLLELARLSTTEHVDDAGGDGLEALGLSEREAEVALLVSEGRTHKEVGAQLFISPKTVEHHVARIRQKLGASSRAELLAIIREASGG